MSDKIILTGIRVFGRHGCSFEEQTLGQFFKVDVEMSVDLSKSGKSDSIEDTVDYARVMFLVEQIVSGEPRKLIESVAEEIAAEILNRYEKVDGVKVVLHKPYAPLHVHYADAAVEIFRDRNSVSAVDTTIDNEPLTLYLKRTLRGVNLTVEATCEKRSANEFVVLKGSYISPIQSESIPNKTKQLRKTAKRTPDNILLEDVTFSTASAAAEFVVGNMANGLQEWKTADGIPLGDL